MKKRYIICIFAIIAVIIFALDIFFGSKTTETKLNTLNGPRIGQKLWTYNMNKYEWRNHNEHDEDDSKGEIVLQYQGPEIGNGFTSYKLLTGNFQVPKEDVWVGEGSQEFLVDKNLYSYFPRSRFRKVVLPFPFLPINPSFQSVSTENEISSNILSKLPS